MMENNNANGAAYTPPPYPMPERVTYGAKPSIEFTSAEKAFSLIIYPTAFLLFKFTVGETASIVTTAVCILLITAVIIFMRCSNKKFTANSITAAVLLYVFSLVYSITDDSFIKFLDTVFLILLMIYMCYSLGGGLKRIPRFLPSAMVQGAFEYPFNNFEKQPRAAAKATGGGIGKRIAIIILALLLAAPLTLIVAKLLISADENMEIMLDGVMELIFSDSLSVIIWQLVVSIPISFYIFGLMYSSVHRDPNRDMTEEKWQRKLYGSRRISDLALCTAITPVCLMYLMFFISQASYLLSAFVGRLPENFSYAGYARRGFFELLAIALINLVIIIFLNLLAKRAAPTAIKFYSVMISFFTLVVIASALSKMAMYISVYGLTRLRLFTGWFMALCAFVFIFIIIRQFTPKLNLSAAVSVVFTIMFALLVFCRPDYVIAKYDTYMDKSGELQFYDSAYLLELSDDALCVYLEEGCDDGGMTDRRLKERKTEKEESITSRWNLSSILTDMELNKS